MISSAKSTPHHPPERRHVACAVPLLLYTTSIVCVSTWITTSQSPCWHSVRCIPSHVEHLESEDASHIGYRMSSAIVCGVGARDLCWKRKTFSSDGMDLKMFVRSDYHRSIAQYALERFGKWFRTGMRKHTKCHHSFVYL